MNISKIKVSKIYKWLKKKRISEQEMMRTFNCGIGFCLICPKKNILKIKKIFPKNFKPYEVGYISKNKTKVNLIDNVRW